MSAGVVDVGLIFADLMVLNKLFFHPFVLVIYVRRYMKLRPFIKKINLQKLFTEISCLSYLW